DGLVALGAQRTWAWAPSTWTAPSVVSIMSGMPVRQHGWDFPFPKKMDAAHQTYPPLPDVPLLAEALGQAGFHTSGLYANRLLGQGLGFGRGFDQWVWGEDDALVSQAVQDVAAWDPDQRYFVYLHLMGPHHPLAPSVRSRAHWGMTKKDLGRDGAIGLPEVREGGPLEQTLYFRAYHAAVEDTDDRLGQLMRVLRPVLDHTALIITSDHGELLGEHNRLGHQAGVFEPLTRVPFVAVHAPALSPLMSVAALASVATKAAGVPHDWPTSFDDITLLVAQREGDVELSLDGVHKGVWDPSIYGDPVSFDLSVDPGEQHPIRPVPQAILQARATFDAQVPAGSLQAEEGGMSDELRQALEQLGYLGG
ncbi:MAG: sulfatase-like hydrolase/transferase, partial [Oligoflexia bacterium]|nr:sulfatase-like hydrolase/transferase [Oligoflexia bacterium]